MYILSSESTILDHHGSEFLRMALTFIPPPPLFLLSEQLISGTQRLMRML